MGEKWDGQGEGEGVPVWASHPDYPGLIWSDYSLCEQAIHTNVSNKQPPIAYVTEEREGGGWLLGGGVMIFHEK